VKLVTWFGSKLLAYIIGSWKQMKNPKWIQNFRVSFFLFFFFLMYPSWIAGSKKKNYIIFRHAEFFSKYRISQRNFF
jgi:hypothetical protein